VTPVPCLTLIGTLAATILQRTVGREAVVKGVDSLLLLQMLPNLIWLLSALNNQGSLFKEVSTELRIALAM
jgi:hypothetical protein